METLYTSVLAVVRDTARVAKVRGRESPRSRWHHRYHGHGLYRDPDRRFAIKISSKWYQKSDLERRKERGGFQVIIDFLKISKDLKFEMFKYEITSSMETSNQQSRYFPTRFEFFQTRRTFLHLLLDDTPLPAI